MSSSIVARWTLIASMLSPSAASKPATICISRPPDQMTTIAGLDIENSSSSLVMPAPAGAVIRCVFSLPGRRGIDDDSRKKRRSALVVLPRKRHRSPVRRASRGSALCGSSAPPMLTVNLTPSCWARRLKARLNRKTPGSTAGSGRSAPSQNLGTGRRAAVDDFAQCRPDNKGGSGRFPIRGLGSGTFLQPGRPVFHKRNLMLARWFLSWRHSRWSSPARLGRARLCPEFRRAN